MKRIISISLALLMLLSNTGFSMNTHFCAGKAVETSFSIGMHNPGCGMADVDENSKISSSTVHQVQINPEPCCQNQHQLLQLDHQTDIPNSVINVNPVFFIAFVHAFVQPLVVADQMLLHKTDYFSPKPDKDIQILFQIFLI